MSLAPAGKHWGLTGHAEVIDQLAASVEAGRVAHAYLVTGPQGVGRTSLARALARALNCEADSQQRPCNACPTCLRIARGAHPDVTVVDLAWQDQMITRERSSTPRSRQRLSIDAIKWLRSDIVSRPLQGRWKIQIIDDAELMTDDASNAYLKTLEEPPPFAVIILIARSADSVPETIRSRCQHLSMGSVPTPTIHAALLERGIADDISSQISRAARGRIAWALDISSNPDRLEKRRAKIEAALEQVVSPLGRISITGVMARDHSRKRDETLESIELWMGLWRDALLYQTGLSERAAYPEVSDRLQHYASRWTVDDLYRALWATHRCATDLDSNVQARIALQAMVLQWPE